MLNTRVQAAVEGLPERHTAIATAMLRLEEQVAELTAMSRIMADLLNDVLFDDREVEEGYSSIRISAQDMTNLAFAVNNVASRAGKLEAHYYAACSGEVGQ